MKMSNKNWIEWNKRRKLELIEIEKTDMRETESLRRMNRMINVEIRKVKI